MAQTYGVGVANAPFGYVASAVSGDTIFTIPASTGLVPPPSSGSGGRVSTNAANVTVTISCSGSASGCNNKNVNVRVGLAGSPSNRLKAITAFNVANGSATISNLNTSTPTNITFTLTPIGSGSSKTFKLGMTFPVKGDNSGSLTGPANTGYFVSVAAAPTTPPSSSSSTGVVEAIVYKSLTMTKQSDLSFGRIVRPLTGSGSATITLNGNGTKGLAAPAIWLSSPAAVRAMFTVTGLPSATLNVQTPTFTMNRTGGGSLTVTPIQSFTTTPSLDGTGSRTFFVGGSFSLPDNTPGGTYSGTFTTTVSYN